jgi:membrane fusion protein, multidrug efflux system
MTGILSSLTVEEGRRVSSGAILARFDVAEPEAELRRARTLLRNAEATHRRAGELHQRELISDVDFEQARADMQVAQSEVSSGKPASRSAPSGRRPRASSRRNSSSAGTR